MSTLKVIRTLLENLIDVGETDVSTDPTSTILDIFLNRAARAIVRKDKPRELFTSTPIDVNITINTNTVSLPATILMPHLVFYKESGGAWTRLRQQNLKNMINLVAPNQFLDTTNVGNPVYYDVQGTVLMFNKYFSRTATGAIKIFGWGPPTEMTAAAETTVQVELPEDYDYLMSFEAAIKFYMKDDDLENQQKFEAAAARERADLRTQLRTNEENYIALDPDVFGGDVGSPKTNQDIFFRS